MILDHAPWCGPLHYDWKCRVCDQPVALHGGPWARWRYRQGVRRRQGVRIDWAGLSLRDLIGWRKGTTCLARCNEMHAGGRWCQTDRRRP